MSSIVRCTKTQKPDDAETQDRISDLPDSVVQHILSFLTTKHAVATSVLSSRWKYVWTSVPVLEFKVADVRRLYSMISLDQKGFINFVDRVLLLHNQSNVSKFCLWCKAPRNLSRLNTWITTAIIKCKLQELDVRVTYLSLAKEPFVFPSCLFTHQPLSSLVSLNINMTCALKLPASIHFAKLKMLHLNTIKFSCDYSTHQVLFDLPALQEFDIAHFELMNIQTLIISAPKLNKLTIIDSTNNHTSAIGCQIKIYAPSITFLHLYISLLHDYSLNHLPSLVKAYVQVYDGSADVNDQNARVTNLLRVISNVKDLTVITSITLFEALSVPYHSSSSLALSFVINLTICEDQFLNFRDLVRLLHILPNLQTLRIDNEIHIEDEEDWTLTVKPKCLSHLKSIKLDVFSGNADELHVVSFFLKNATILDRMTIVTSEDLSDDKLKFQVTKQLLMVPRSSTQCIIDFS